LDEPTDIQLNGEALRPFYQKYFSYFGTLNEYWKNVFISRCLKFASEKIIVGADGFKPNNQVKAIIAASAVQLTLGLETWSLNYFDTIIIHPKDFDSRAGGLKYKGETNLAGYIRLSWQSFISGYRVGNDNINLGLHEFSHALRFNPITGFDQDYFIEHYFNGWLASANEAYNDIRNNRNAIFRKYGGTNINEFMSVCIEHFFESPGQIKEHYPHLYYSTAILLNQCTGGAGTEINIRQKLFEEKNSLLKVSATYELKTNWRKNSSFAMFIVIAVPFIYTAVVTGLLSGATLVLVTLLMAVYLRFDYNYIHSRIENNRLFLRKGYLIFKNRRKVDVRLSQLVSVRITGNGGGDTELDLIYYDFNEHSFYEDSIPVGHQFENGFLRDIVSSRIAVFKN
jgi:MtfA peptidase